MDEAKKARERQDESPREGKEKTDTAGRPREIGGPRGPEPTRYGDWERKGRCVDF